MSVSDNAQALISHSSDYIQNAMGLTNNASDSLGRAIEALGQLRTVTMESVSNVTGLLGGGHPSVSPIAGLGQAVQSKADEIQSAIASMVDAVIELDQSANTYASTMGSVGHVLLKGGN